MLNCKSDRVLFIFQINVASTEDGMNFYDSGHRFEHLQILLVLLRSLPYASKGLQSRALQVPSSFPVPLLIRPYFLSL